MKYKFIKFSVIMLNLLCIVLLFCVNYFLCNNVFCVYSMCFVYINVSHYFDCVVSPILHKLRNNANVSAL